MKKGSITLLESVDIRAANEWHTELLRTLSGVDEIILDASAVERIDTAGLQLLLAFPREAQLRNMTVQLHAAASALRESLQASGLDTAMRSLTT